MTLRVFLAIILIGLSFAIVHRAAAQTPDDAVSITKSGPLTTSLDGLIRYHLTVTNRSPHTLTNVRVMDALPQHTVYRPDPDAAHTLINNTVVWTLPTLNGNGTTQRLTFTVTAAQQDLRRLGLSKSTSTHTPCQYPPFCIPPSHDSRIVGGQESRPHAWPHQAALVDRVSQRLICGGVLISEQWVLTAAHCLFDNQGNRLTDAQFTLRLGVHQLSQTEGVQRDIGRSIVHEFFPFAGDPDIALLRLAEPISLTANIQPIRYASLVDHTLFEPTTLAIATGWGQPSESDPPVDRLRQVTLPLVANESCGSRITVNNLCAGNPTRPQSVCRGDSGGPLVTQNFIGETILIGLVGRGSGGQCGATYSIFTHVGQLADWIEQNSGVTGGGQPVILNHDYGVMADGVQLAVGQNTVSTTVLSADHEPRLITSSPITTAIINTPYAYHVALASSTRRQITVTALAIPAWLTLTAQTNGTPVLNGTPAATDAGRYLINLQAITHRGLINRQVFSLTVSDRFTFPINPSTHSPLIAPIGVISQTTTPLIFSWTTPDGTPPIQYQLTITRPNRTLKVIMITDTVRYTLTDFLLPGRYRWTLSARDAVSRSHTPISPAQFERLGQRLNFLPLLTKP